MDHIAPSHTVEDANQKSMIREFVPLLNVSCHARTGNSMETQSDGVPVRNSPKDSAMTASIPAVLIAP
jgi:hypothetical protein